MPQMPEGFDPSAMSGAVSSEDGAQEEEKAGFDVKQALSSAVSAVRGAYNRVMAWLYEDVQLSADAVTGSLVEVTVGMQNEDYAEILSGLNAGQTVLYTSDDSESSTSGFSFGGMGGMGGMPGGRMGF